jgi:hypothetical protein
MNRVLRINKLRLRYQSSDTGISIDEAVVQGRRQKCTKPEDRIWGMTGLSPELKELANSPDCRHTLSDLTKLMTQGRSVSMEFRIRTWYRLMVHNELAKLPISHPIKRRSSFGKSIEYFTVPLLSWSNMMRYLKAAHAEGWRDFDYWWNRDELDGVQGDTFILEEWIKLISSNASYKMRMV